MQKYGKLHAVTDVDHSCIRKPLRASSKIPESCAGCHLGNLELFIFPCKLRRDPVEHIVRSHNIRSPQPLSNSSGRRLSVPASLFILFRNGTNHPARIADSHRVVRNIFNNNTAAAHHNIASDRNPRHDMNARSDPNIAAHRDGIRIFQSLFAPLGINGVLPCRSRSSVQ